MAHLDGGANRAAEGRAVQPVADTDHAVFEAVGDSADETMVAVSRANVDVAAPSSSEATVARRRRDIAGGGSWLRAPVGVDARDGAGHVGLAVDHVASIDHHGGNLGDAQSPGIRDTLVGVADAALKGLAAVMQPCRTRAAACCGSAGRCAASSTSMRVAWSSSMIRTPAGACTG